MSRKQGALFESLALNFLQEQGFTLLEKNWSCRFGEIDLIMQNANTLVFVEVKARSNNYLGGAINSLTPKKQQKLILTASLYVQQHKLENMNSRFDFVYIQNNKINWIPFAFIVEDD